MGLMNKIKQICIASLKNVYVKLTQKNSSLNVRELFLSQFKDNYFCRFDIIVRYLFIEQFYGKNDYGYSLYEKMQRKRLKTYFDPDCIEYFKNIIQSYEKNGYDANSKISIGNHMQLLDGSHRVALGLYFGEFIISTTITKIRSDVDYSIEWFIANDFTDDEISIILRKEKELEKKFNMPFQCILWPPTEKLQDEITADIEKLAKIISYKELRLSKFECEFFIKQTYAVDDIEEWKVHKKIENMVNESNEVFTIRIIEILLERPEFRLKKLNCKTLSHRGEQIKSVIRTKYKTKVENYYFDNVIHIADNFYQNKHIDSLKQINIDISSFFEQILNQNYVLAKHDAPYMPENFPHTVPYGKDIDILCTEDSKQQIVNTAVNFCKKNIVGLDISQIELDNGRIQIRIELDGFAVFIWDITLVEEGLNSLFTKDAVNNSHIWNGIKVMSTQYEVIYRDNLLRYKSKPYHEDYVRKHKDELNLEMKKIYHE